MTKAAEQIIKEAQEMSPQQIARAAREHQRNYETRAGAAEQAGNSMAFWRNFRKAEEWRKVADRNES